jgi:hypothetical protein
MRAVFLTLIISTAFIFNGCALIDRLFAQNAKKKTIKTTNVNYQKITSQNSVTNNKKLASGKLVAKKKKYSKKYYAKKKKRVKYTNKKTKKYYAKKRKKLKYTKKKMKKYYTKRKKYIKKFIAYEPYSLERNELDPELLGPQTTITKNPLLKKKAL